MRNPETQERSRRSKITIAVVAGSLLLGACAQSDFRPTEKVSTGSLSECTIAEATSNQAVDPNKHVLVDERDYEQVKKAVRTSPSLLLDMAKRLPSPTNSKNSLLHGLHDNAHHSWHPSDMLLGHDTGSLDPIDVPSDILCKVTSAGQGSGGQSEAYYDQDGLSLLGKVENALDIAMKDHPVTTTTTSH